MIEQSALVHPDNQASDARNCSIVHAILVVGIGSSHGDDQIGWFVAKELMRRSLNHCQIRIVGNPLEILDWLDECNVLHLVDSCKGDGPPGAIYRWDWPCEEIEVGRWSGTHDFNLAGVLALAEQLDQLPKRIVVWGVESGNVHLDNLLSENATVWVNTVADLVDRSE
jgi:hydrogenase maturation protease